MATTFTVLAEPARRRILDLLLERLDALERHLDASYGDRDGRSPRRGG